MPDPELLNGMIRKHLIPYNIREFRSPRSGFDVEISSEVPRDSKELLVGK
jgi:hypothetical protein